MWPCWRTCVPGKHYARPSLSAYSSECSPQLRQQHLPASCCGDKLQAGPRQMQTSLGHAVSSQQQSSDRDRVCLRAPEGSTNRRTLLLRMPRMPRVSFPGGSPEGWASAMERTRLTAKVLNTEDISRRPLGLERA